MEAKIIRHEEHKLKRQIQWAKDNNQDWAAKADQWFSLNEHRRYDVRNENRATFLARAFIAGKSYKSVEAKGELSKEGIFLAKVLPRVLALVKKYDNPNIDLKHIQAWIDVE